MQSSRTKGRANEWLAYYDRFDDVSPQAVREGCHPRALVHAGASAKAIVLAHGLTDSPYFLSAIAHHFHARLGYNVYLPLLQGHGLKAPQGMEGVSLEAWKANLKFAIDTAAASAAQVSVGGLSTGGTLSFYMACTHPGITGDLYLFSAALDLAGGPLRLFGELKERLLRTFLADLLDKNQPLIGRNPYRYARMDLDGARELAHLIKETDALLEGFGAHHPFPTRVFAAHSACDTTADIQGIQRLQAKTPPERFTLYLTPQSLGVAHASLVLETPIQADDAAEGDAPLEQANPVFADMMAAVTGFQQAS